MIDKSIEFKLIYIHKIGYTTKNEGLYEFIFSKDPQNIDVEQWGWDLTPACDNCIPPTDNYIDKVVNLKTNKFDLFCLHEAVERPYLHGYHTIHALAYEKEDYENSENGYSNYDDLFNNDENEFIENDDLPLLVFHYGMTFEQVSDIFYEREIIYHKGEFKSSSSIKI